MTLTQTSSLLGNVSKVRNVAHGFSCYDTHTHKSFMFFSGLICHSLGNGNKNSFACGMLF